MPTCARAGNVTLVSLACTVPCELGFCICCDAGPFLKEWTDVQLTDLGEHLLAEPYSDKGLAMLSEAGELFRPARPDEQRRRLELEEEAKRAFGAETCHFASAMRRVSTGRVPDALWDAMGDWCLECGGCNFVCPTCYCFSVKDMRQDGVVGALPDLGLVPVRGVHPGGLRATTRASGTRTASSDASSTRSRARSTTSATATVGCVGCGRCVKVCLGTTDMPAVVAAIRKGAWNG